MSESHPNGLLDRAARAPRAIQGWLLGPERSSHGLAVMRIGYGAMTLILMAMYLPHLSYSFGRAATWATPFQESSAVNDYRWPILEIFSRDDSDSVLLVKYVLLAVVALLFTLGWRMRIVAPLFLVLWLSFTTINPVITNTGHYQTFRVMLIFMVFADLSRRWSLDAVRKKRRPGPRPRVMAGLRWPLPRWVPRLCNNAAVVLIGYQLCLIYVVSAMWKLQGTTWEAGVAIYYPLRLEELALFPGLNDVVWGITPLVYLGSWAGVYLQLVFPLLLLHRWTRVAALILVTMMHVGIAVLLSLPFFSATMLCADAVFVRESTWTAVTERVRARLPRRRERERTVTPPALVADA